MKHFARVALVLSALCSFPLYAGSTTTNKTVQYVGVGPMYDTQCGYKCMLIAFATPPTGSPCTFTPGWHYAIDISTSEGRTVAAVILTAKANQSVITAAGNGTCIYGNGIEQLLYAYM